MEREMRVSHVIDLLEETGLSPEAVGEQMDVSGMTIRRWLRRPPEEILPPLYADATRWAIYKLIVDGRLRPDSRSAQWAFSTTDAMAQKARLVACGFPVTNGGPVWNEEEVLKALEKLGQSEDSRENVCAQMARVESYRTYGQGWDDSIGTALKVITRPTASARLKSIAYGALCYLLFPFDLIHDAIPIVGLIDDFSMLSAMAAYCRRMLNL